MSTTTPRQQKLVKMRKASRIGACLLIFGGAALLLMGLAVLSLPEVLDGVVMMASSTLLFAASKIVEKKLSKPDP